MTCCCDKLRAENYSAITETEAVILKHALEKAPHLFTNPQPSECEERFNSPSSFSEPLQQRLRSSHKKRPRTSSHTPSSQVKQLGDTPPDISQEQPSNAIQLAISRSCARTSHNTAVVQEIASAAVLEKTYCCQNLEGILKDNGCDLRTQGSARPLDIIVDIILAIERSDQIIEIKQLSKRLYCYVLAKLHMKGTSVDNIVQRVQSALGNHENIKAKVYHYLRIGNKWGTIVDLFESIFKGFVVQQPEIRLTGILCVLGTGSLWERASIGDCRMAFANLCAKTDICEQVTIYSPIVDEVVRKLLSTQSFIHIPNPYANTSSSKPDNVKSLSMTRRFHTASSAVSHWKTPSIAAASRALHGLKGFPSEEAQLLLLLLSFLASSEVPPNLLIRGASPRKHWNERGEIAETEAIYHGLVPNLMCLLSDVTKLNDTFVELLSLSVISRNANETYTLDCAIQTRVSDCLPPDLHTIWRLQALVVAYRSIPWKYLEPGPSPNMRDLFIPHIQHTLQRVQHHDDFQELSADTRTDVSLTLIEASRFPNMVWKRFTLSQAKVAMRGMNDEYLQSNIAQRESILHRITGCIDQAIHALENASIGQSQLQADTDKRMHAGFGQTVIQRTLNHIQKEELVTAINILDAWQPLFQRPSTIEEVVLFRKQILLGKISRFQGNFRESLAYLERSREIANECNDLFFDEDRCDLVCDIADTFLELDDPVKAEHCLRTQLACQSQDRASPRSLLKLILAESLFAQRRYDEAETVCLEVQSCRSLLKMGKLRLSIIRAKLCHINSDWDGAFRHWTDAMLAVGKFNMTNGCTTRIILLSICDILRCQRQYELELKSRNQLAALEQLTGPAGVLYWIGGLRHWLEYLQSTDRSRWSRI